MRGRRGRVTWPVVLAVVLVVVGCDLVREVQTSTTLGPAGTAAPGTTGTTGAPGSTATAQGNQSPVRFAPQVIEHSTSAEINPQLLMAILFNESYKPHDPALQRAWQNIDPDAAFGIANMHQAAFDDTKQGRDFEARDWQELPDDPELAIQAAAWFLHDLDAQLPERLPETYTRDEFLALGYNAGAGSMLSFVEGARPGALAQSYVDRLRANWQAAGEAVSDAT